MKVIIYKTETGIKTISASKEIKIEDQTKYVPKDAEYKIVDDSEFPTDNAYTESWTYDLKEDIKKVRVVKKNMLRVERGKRFKVLDDDYLKALKTKDIPLQEKIESESQILRDLPQLVDPCKTIAEIKAIAI